MSTEGGLLLVQTIMSSEEPCIAGLEPVYTQMDERHSQSNLRYGRFRVTRPQTPMMYGYRLEAKAAWNGMRRDMTEQLRLLLETETTVTSHTKGRVGTEVSNAAEIQALVSLSLDARDFFRAMGLAGIQSLQYSIPIESAEILKNWSRFRRVYQRVIPDMPETPPLDQLARLYGGTIPGREDLLTPAELMSSGAPFQINAPFAVAVAKLQLRLDIQNGASGKYWDCPGYPACTGYEEHQTQLFRQWLKGRLGDEAARSLFGHSVDALVPPDMGSKKDLLYKDMLLTTAELDRSLFAPSDDRHVEPLLAAFIRYRLESVADYERALADYGRGLTDGYVSAATYYVDDSGPHFYAYICGYTVENLVQRGRALSFVLWEPWKNNPHRGFKLGEPRESWGDPLEAERRREPYLYPEVHGRRSNSSMLKYISEASLPAPAITKTWPKPPAKDGIQPMNLAMLNYVEAWANLAAIRAIIRPDCYPFEAVKRMNGFQARNEQLFLGARRYDRLAVWCSMQQAWARRYDCSLGISRMLLDADIEHRIINDRAIDENAIDDLDCIILANVRVMTDLQIRIINDWARRQDKGLILIGRNADRDEWDRCRPDGVSRLTEGVPAHRVQSLGLDVYPRLAHTGSYRIQGLGDDLEPLRQAVLKVHGPHLTYIANTPESVEVHPLRIDSRGCCDAPKGGDEIISRRPLLVVHIVNYDVDIYGRAAASVPFSLMVRLPFGDVQPSNLSAHLYEPCKEPSAEEIAGGLADVPAVSLPLGVKVLHGVPYVAMEVPPVRLGAIIAVGC